ncbi:MAG: hypothetical protein IPN90_14030 [Elusimicrobia bacterium]|nr:hypothetical protein [Elusimicrobiota bacterium]
MALTRVVPRPGHYSARFRRELHLEEYAIKVVRIGRSLILARRGMVGFVSKNLSGKLKKRISFDDLLKDLKKTRKEIHAKSMAFKRLLNNPLI